MGKQLAKLFGKKDMRILMLGLDAAGKTSIPHLEALVCVCVVCGVCIHVHRIYTCTCIYMYMHMYICGSHGTQGGQACVSVVNKFISRVSDGVQYVFTSSKLSQYSMMA